MVLYSSFNLDNHRIYGELSKAHKDGQLNIDETRGILYQADGLIGLLLDSLT